MANIFTAQAYQDMINDLFQRFPSFGKVGKEAYKPGIDNMVFFDQLLGSPHKSYKTIHVAGTNGKGSVSNMLASTLAAGGLRVGLYTSPHILDFRERMRYRDDSTGELVMISQEEVWGFVNKWSESFDHLGLSFFEITTAMALWWFNEKKVDVAIIETGLGGRLDSTNIITPILSVITNIGLDHCDILGDSLGEIAFEKAGIIKPLVPVVVGESSDEIDEVFNMKVLYTNLSQPEFMGDRSRIMALLTFADKVRADVPKLSMDLGGEYQVVNLRTVMAALQVIQQRGLIRPGWVDSTHLNSALETTAARMGFRGRWEATVFRGVRMISDIGHNAHGLRYNFRQLGAMLDSGEVSQLIMVFGVVSDKDVDSIFPLLPRGASLIFTKAAGARAMPVESLVGKYLAWAGEGAQVAGVCGTVGEAMDLAAELAGEGALIYVGGSTFVVSEAALV